MLSRYTIVDKLGSGGIGVVYRAEDRSLKRQVALKFLSDASLAKPHVRARFLREARLAAALNHPGICTVHEVGECVAGEELQLEGGPTIGAGTPFIVMELVEGRSLDAVLAATGPLPIEELLKIAVQIADALAEAHSKSIVHRDLKPQNVMVTPDGRIKLLDFGLAKPLFDADEGDDVMRTSESLSVELTREGMVVGTVAYMSPEQAKGKPVDSRSDVFSLGCMLYEMIAGHKTFGGESANATLAKILETEPPSIADSRDGLPADLVRIVHRCLRKQPDVRYNDTRDLAVALRDLLQEASSGAVPRIDSGMASGARLAAGPRRASTRGVLGWALAAGAALIAAAALGFLAPRLVGGRSAPAPPSFRQITYTGAASFPALSPDGQYVAYLTDRSDGSAVMIQDMSGGQPLQVFQASLIRSLRWSPRGSDLLVAGRGADGQVHTYLVPRLGGTPRPLPYLPFVTWAPTGDRLAGTSLSAKEIRFVDTSTGSTTSIALEGDFQWIYDVEWSPDGDLLAFLTRDQDGGHAIRTSTVDGARQQIVVERDTGLFSPRFSPRGDALYYLADRDQTRELRKTPIDPRSGIPKGESLLLLSGLNAGDQIALSDDGLRLLYTRESSHSNLWSVEPDDEAGPRTARLTSGTLLHASPRISPDGRLLAFSRGNRAGSNIFVMTLADGSFQQLTFLDSDTWEPAWSPAGDELAFGATKGDSPRVWRIGSSGGAPRPFQKTIPGRDLVWAPGARLLYQQQGGSTYRLLDPDTEAEAPLIDEGGDDLGSTDPLYFFSWMSSPQYSPDGRRVAINCNCPDGAGVWIVDIDRGRRRLLLEEEQALPVRWSADGASVYALLPDTRELIRISVDGGDAQRVLRLPFERVGELDMTPDGRRVVCSVPERQADVWLVENFDPYAD